MQKNYKVFTRKDIKAIGGLISPDERFKVVKEQPGWFISNYARLASKRKNGTAVLLHPLFRNGYQGLVTYNRVNGKRVATEFKVHVLVASAFVNVPGWIRDNEIIEVHHRRKVNHAHAEYGTDFAENLTYLPKSIHKTVDAVREIGVCKGGVYQNMDFVSAAFYMGIDPYALADVIRQEPDSEDEDGKYYDCLVNYGGKPVDLEFRIFRYKTNRGDKVE